MQGNTYPSSSWSLLCQTKEKQTARRVGNTILAITSCNIYCKAYILFENISSHWFTIKGLNLSIDAFISPPISFTMLHSQCLFRFEIVAYTIVWNLLQLYS